MLVDTKEGSDPYERYLAQTEAYNVALGSTEPAANYKPLLALITNEQAVRFSKVVEKFTQNEVFRVFPEDSQSRDVVPSPRRLVSSDATEFVFFSCSIDDSFRESFVDERTSHEGIIFVQLRKVFMVKDVAGQWRLDRFNTLEEWHYEMARPEDGWGYRKFERNDNVWEKWNPSIKETAVSTIYPTHDESGIEVEYSPESYEIRS